jgi:hypothetical protein
MSFTTRHTTYSLADHSTSLLPHTLRTTVTNHKPKPSPIPTLAKWSAYQQSHTDNLASSRRCPKTSTRSLSNIEDLSDPNAQGDVPIAVLIYKLLDLANNTTLDSHYDTHSIPGYAITLNAPANQHTASASTTHTSDTPHTHPITTAPLNSSTIDLVSLYFESPSVLPKPCSALS